MSRAYSSLGDQLAAHNSLEFSFNFDSPNGRHFQRTPLSSSRARQPVAVMIAAVVCKYCKGLFRRSTGTPSTDDFVCIHCVDKIERDIQNVNTQGTESTTTVAVQATIEANARPAHSTNDTRLVESCAQTVSARLVERGTQTETPSSIGCHAKRSALHDTIEPNLHADKDFRERPQSTNRLTHSNTNHNAGDDIHPSGKVVFIVGSSNAVRFGRHVHTMLLNDARCRLHCDPRATLRRMVGDVRRYVALGTRAGYEKFVVLHMDLNNLVDMSLNKNICDIWQNIDTQLNRLLTLCHNHKIRLTICSIPVVSRCGSIDRRNDCRYLNTLLAGKIKNTPVDFLNLDFIHGRSGTMSPDGFHYSRHGARLAAKPIAQMIARFLNIQVSSAGIASAGYRTSNHIRPRQTYSRNKSVSLRHLSTKLDSPPPRIEIPSSSRQVPAALQGINLPLQPMPPVTNQSLSHDTNMLYDSHCASPQPYFRLIPPPPLPPPLPTLTNMKALAPPEKEVSIYPYIPQTGPSIAQVSRQQEPPQVLLGSPTSSVAPSMLPPNSQWPTETNPWFPPHAQPPPQNLPLQQIFAPHPHKSSYAVLPNFLSLLPHPSTIPDAPPLPRLSV